MHQFIDQVISKVRESAQEFETGPETSGWRPGQFIRHVIKQTVGAQSLRVTILQMLLGGRDTTSGLLSNLRFTLASRPDVWKKLQAEVALLKDNKPTVEQLKELKYVRWCINEGR